MTTIELEGGGLYLVFAVTSQQAVRLVYFAALPMDPDSLLEEDIQTAYPLVELQFSGENHDDHHAHKHTGTSPGRQLRYVSHSLRQTAQGRELTILQCAGDIQTASHFLLTPGAPVTTCWTEVTNNSETPVILEYISSFALYGLMGPDPCWDKAALLFVGHNTWKGECRWRSYTLPQLGLSRVETFSMKRVCFQNTGSWSTVEYLPMGLLRHTQTESNLIWQIEHNGSWYYEIGDLKDDLYLHLSGPTGEQSQFYKQLLPGEGFSSVPVAVGCTQGCVDDAFHAMTRHRRFIRRDNDDNKRLPIVFNDYMNCLMGDPTTEKLIPIIDCAASLGCEYYCVDCGWYDDGCWWDTIGQWQPSPVRFPGGLPRVLSYIRNKGMISGLWLEIENMGIRCPLADTLPDEWFMTRFGKRVIDHSRYLLDFRHPAVRDYADAVVARLVEEYGVGYIKMDYNNTAGVGCERGAFSFGDGLLQHNRAYLDWIDGLFDRYPQLVIESCSSGGCRMDYAMLKRHSIQSTSDQEDYRLYAKISAAAVTAVTPEQAAVWSYPLSPHDREETVFNMVNVLFLRVHQSGGVQHLEDDSLELIREGLDFYKRRRALIPHSRAFWPLGLPRFEDEFVAAGFQARDTVYMRVWRLNSEDDTVCLPLNGLRVVAAAIAYPLSMPVPCRIDNGCLYVTLPQKYSARVLKLMLEVSGL